MKNEDKLVMNWCKKEKTCMIRYPLGNQTKCAAMFMLKILSDKVLKELEEDYGYDRTTFKFSIEPQEGNQDFASQREGTEE